MVNILDKFGKKWYKGLWHPTNCWSENAYGYIPQRRREGAVLQQKAAQWWLIRQHLGWCCSSYDISNAFPSMTKVRLSKVVDEVVGKPDKDFMKKRHERALMMIEVPSEWRGSEHVACCATGTGDLQGDGPAAQKYILAAGPAIEQAAKDAETIVAEHALNFVEPCTRRKVNIGHITFADDVLMFSSQEWRALRSRLQ